MRKFSTGVDFGSCLPCLHCNIGLGVMQAQWFANNLRSSSVQQPGV